ncbi:hypothetical protein EOB36_25490 [Mesorhizobium sp. M6A.T.Cr.TU.017.01.1.1]|uniref:hypothetical protein n=1 Tax=Mesorhizobium sp. M6A.T.Cr.TU.017.01.1.1 TaxID=2496774 RepID=UPI000FD53BF0|nr:hypothetical protein [Mesorhizobium sp. M6A.T.Cr.TU.017.01.1.1]RUU97858.1 hypothetical protein EOB36_25490 [Mesorhizobium sp. M6A.T.Cr.TU.017.01.1.1]
MIIKTNTPSMESADAYNAEVSANATRFAASLFLGRGKFANAEANTREEIDAAAAQLSADNPNATAKPIIVAFDATGNQTVVSGKPHKAPKAEKAPKAAKAPKADKPAGGKRAEILASAEAGTLPAKPDFSAATHGRFRKKLDEIIALVEAGDIKALKAYPINPISSSSKAMDRYRNLAVTALEAQRKAAKAAR